MKIVATSDTHSRHGEIEVPDGDVFIHAGDFSKRGRENELIDFNNWLGTLPHSTKIVVAGNHDWCFEKQPERSRELLTNAIYLKDSSVTIDSIKFYGSPWQPWFFDWAFNLERGPALAEKWQWIPEDVDVLVTHGPPLGHGDMTVRGEAVGCADLLQRVHEVKPRLHIFGHIHEGAGVTENEHTTFINASALDFQYNVAYTCACFEISPNPPK